MLISPLTENPREESTTITSFYVFCKGAIFCLLRVCEGQCGTSRVGKAVWEVARLKAVTSPRPDGRRMKFVT